MDDRTLTGNRDARPALCYLFWTGGAARGGWARLDPDGTTLGTGRAADVVMDDAAAAGEQARIRREGDEWFLYDLAGNGSTLVDEQPIYRAALVDKSRIILGRSAAVFRIIG